MTPAFIDTHLHVWNPERIRYGWLNEAPPVLNQVREPDQIREEARASGMRRAVLVQAANTLDETHYLLEQAGQHDWIAGVVGWVDLPNPSVAAAQLKELTKNALFKGVRHLIHGESDDRWLLQEPVLESLALVADYHLTYDVVGINLTHLACAMAVAQRLPTLSLILDHLNQPPADWAQATEWKSRMQEAASYATIAAKISGLGTATQKGLAWHQADIQPWLEFVLETFGPDRLMLGSDWPVCLLAGTYRHATEQYTTGIRQLVTPEETDQIFRTNAERLYHL